MNSWLHKPGELKTVMQRANINWRTFDDRGDINQQWNAPATPAFYIIDHEGIIRRKWIGKPGGEVIDRVLDELIESAGGPR